MVHITFKSGFVDTRKGKGWAAILVPTQNGEVERKFIDTQKTWGKGGYVFTFQGDYPEGTILEIAQGGSWKNTYRSYYQVTASNLQHIGNYDSIKAKQTVAQILGIPHLKFAWKKEAE